MSSQRPNVPSAGSTTSQDDGSAPASTLENYQDGSHAFAAQLRFIAGETYAVNNAPARAYQGARPNVASSTMATQGPLINHPIHPNQPVHYSSPNWNAQYAHQSLQYPQYGHPPPVQPQMYFVPDQGYVQPPMVYNQFDGSPYAQQHYGYEQLAMPAQYAMPGQPVTPYQPHNQAFAPRRPGAHSHRESYGNERHRRSANVQPRERQHDALQGDASPVPRGPPRKPKLSGFAMWVGNLPPHASVFDLKDLFSEGFFRDIVSLRLMPHSNSAFVNYKTEEKCLAAVRRFQESRFQGMRLVCRMRKATTPAQTSGTSGADESREQTDGAAEGETVQDAYFIMKSLTAEDLLASTQTNIWTTQPHVEDVLNKAFTTAANVFLIFSVNKSGEYFGYARMKSLVGGSTGRDTREETSLEPSETIARTPEPMALPVNTPGIRIIPTAETSSAPAGKVTEDDARGIVFWDADTDETEELARDLGEVALDNDARSTTASEVESQNENASLPGATTPLSANEATLSGRVFDIEWLSLKRVHFSRTKNLRNPLNDNREVKIARDGTRLAPDIGLRLLAMFH